MTQNMKGKTQHTLAYSCTAK